MTTEFPELRALGDTAVTLRFGAGIDPAIHARVLGFARALEAHRAELPEVVEWLPTFDSVSVYFDPAVADPQATMDALQDIARRAGAEARPGRRWRIPVCFEADYAPDLAELAAAGGIGVGEAVRQLTTARLRVYMLGFLPGFPYMGGLPPGCDQPRRATPRTAVPARSLAAAAGMCAIYPWESPGGWHLIGRTPVRPFAIVDGEAPALFAAGDEVRLQAISGAEYEVLDREAESTGLARERFLERDGN
ncbi:MAG: allophanate hydrolase subunit 1 [Rhodocyclales bacterium]|nr:allophanate hydrolase subunit 1 [Rhodocyclales bacterium]